MFAALLSTADTSPLSTLEVVAHIMYKEECVNTHAVASAKESDADRMYRRYCLVRAWTWLRFLEGARDRRWL